MKQVILAVAIASVCGAASAATVSKSENGDYLKVYGGMEVGGTFVADTDKSPLTRKETYVDDSFMTLGAKGQTGNYFAKFELDAQRQTWTEKDGFELVIDKAFIGYKMPDKMGSIEVGRTDTAYDHYDAFGDYTNNNSVEVGEAGDQDNTIKYRGQFGNIKIGVSHSLKGVDLTDRREGAVTNGYLGYFGDNFTVIGGAEKVDDRGNIMSIHGEYKMDKIAFGGFVSKSDREKKDADSISFVGSASYKLTETVKAYAAYSKVNADLKKNEDQNFTIGAEYKPARNIKLVAEAAFGQEDTSTIGYAKAFYWF